MMEKLLTDYSAFYIHQASSDPTRTLTLRSKWVAENNRRFAALKAVIRKSVVDNDGFGLLERDHFQAQAALSPAAPRAWAYRWSHEKVDGFMKWLKEMEEKSILEIVHRPGTLRPEGEPWSNLYVRSAYQRGLSMAMARVKETSARMGTLLGLGEADFPPSFLPTGRAISAIMAQPFHADRLALAYTRVFDELKGVSAAMDQQISRELTKGIAQGLNPRDIGDKIADRVEKIGATRGRLIARTETIHVHAQAALNEYYSVEQNTGEVVLIQWSATMDSRTRDKHMERNQRVYTKEEAYALIGEPNCRCALLPYIPAIQGIPEKASDAAMAICKKAFEAEQRKLGKEKKKKIEPPRPAAEWTQHANLDEAEAWAKAKYPNITWDFKGAHIDTINPTLKQLDKLAQDWPEVAERLRFVGTYQQTDNRFYSEKAWDSAPNAWAHASINGERIGLNPRWYGNPEAFKGSLSSSANSGWHPYGCDSIESVVTHEFGHQVEHWLTTMQPGLQAFTDVIRADGFGLYKQTLELFFSKNKATKALSGYATTNQTEGWAEGFSSYYFGKAQTKYQKAQFFFLDFIKTAPRLLEPGRLDPDKKNWVWFQDASQEAKDANIELWNKFQAKGVI